MPMTIRYYLALLNEQDEVVEIIKDSEQLKELVGFEPEVEIAGLATSYIDGSPIVLSTSGEYKTVQVASDIVGVEEELAGIKVSMIVSPSGEVIHRETVEYPVSRI